MKLSAPTQPIFLISLILAILALVSALGISIPVIGGYTVWLALVAYLVLFVGNVMKGM